MLDYALFKTIVDSTPLISIDLIIYNAKSEVLLGKRNNPPAKAHYFVPGGRIYKNEKITEAFQRICKAEIGVDIYLQSARFLGVFEHFYEDAYVGEDISTHYVVLAYEIHMDLELNMLPLAQHNQYVFMPSELIASTSEVHFYTQRYFC
ncbi:TPA: GDP-mannose mannosyl hydrolase [Salmonella enterica]|nr:GDP-mannose mannosyl hydrolase [Salmonella enterica]